jgi:hypothetical protein
MSAGTDEEARAEELAWIAEDARAAGMADDGILSRRSHRTQYGFASGDARLIQRMTTFVRAGKSYLGSALVAGAFVLALVAYEEAKDKPSKAELYAVSERIGDLKDSMTAAMVTSAAAGLTLTQNAEREARLAESHTDEQRKRIDKIDARLEVRPQRIIIEESRK